ncbi:MAG: arginyltransferase [Alphaproteobacteria bacterium]|nr:arginyltransferase [Alphaproteobacteria bacterium]
MKEADNIQIVPADFVRRMKFYLTSPQPCPYLPGQMERKVFANLAVDGAVNLNDSLTRSGFRRSQTIAYRPACATCGACRSVRIDVARFTMTRRWKRVLARNEMLLREPCHARASREQFRLLKRYLSDRHPGGGMTEMELRDYAGMVDASPVRTVVFEYRNARGPDADPDQEGDLQAAALTDVLRDGLSMVYSFYRPELGSRSVGAYMVLDHIRFAVELGLPFVYLGYWVKGSDKMGYKADFMPLEVFDNDAWRPLRHDEL